jgi:hypothetical protein
LALHFAFISLILWAVSLIREGFAVAGAAVVAAGVGAAVWAEARCRLQAASSTAATQTEVRSMGFPLDFYPLHEMEN